VGEEVVSWFDVSMAAWPLLETSPQRWLICVVRKSCKNIDDKASIKAGRKGCLIVNIVGDLTLEGCTNSMICCTSAANACGMTVRVYLLAHI
jgi:hypothetical protein